MTNRFDVLAPEYNKSKKKRNHRQNKAERQSNDRAHPTSKTQWPSPKAQKHKANPSIPKNKTGGGNNKACVSRHSIVTSLNTEVDLTGATFSPFAKCILQSPLTAEKLKTAAEILLNSLKTLPKVLTNSFRLEVFQECDTSDWTVLVRVDVIAYFHAVTKKQQEFFLELQHYLHVHLTQSPDLPDDPTPISIDCPKEQCKYDNCKHTSTEHLNQYNHSDPCSVIQKRCDTVKKPCGFWFNAKLMISCLSNDKFSVLIRREGKRELLVLPKLSDPNLHDNNDLARSNDFWARVLQVSEDIEKRALMGLVKSPIARYHMNFGKWETAANRDEGALYCHGHAHIVLTREAAMHWTNNSQPGYEIFKGHVRTPPDEHQKDCAQLFQLSLMNKMNNFETDITELKVDVAELKVDVAELKTEMKSGFDAILRQLRGEKNGGVM